MVRSSNFPGDFDNAANLPDVGISTPLVPAHWNNVKDAVVSVQYALGRRPSSWPTHADGVERKSIYEVVAGLLGVGVAPADQPIPVWPPGGAEPTELMSGAAGFTIQYMNTLNDNDWHAGEPYDTYGSPASGFSAGSSGLTATRTGHALLHCGFPFHAGSSPVWMELGFTRNGEVQLTRQFTCAAGTRLVPEWTYILACEQGQTLSFSVRFDDLATIDNFDQGCMSAMWVD
jgi:hypothetical protein